MHLVFQQEQSEKTKENKREWQLLHLTILILHLVLLLLLIAFVMRWLLNRSSLSDNVVFYQSRPSQVSRSRAEDT